MPTHPALQAAKVEAPFTLRAIGLVLWVGLWLATGCSSGHKVNQWTDGKYYSAREIAAKKRAQRRLDKGVAKAKETRARATAKTASARTKAPRHGSAKADAYATGAPATTRQAAELIRVARTYTGTPYRSGGTTRLGMDCSGLISTSFQEAGYDLPRTSGEQSAFGADVPTAAVRPGDLLFFATDGPNSRRVSHVGMVTEVRGPQHVQFIHASSSLGVKEDNLFVPYWQRCFLKATRPSLVTRGALPPSLTAPAAAPAPADKEAAPSMAESLRTLGAQ